MKYALFVASDPNSLGEATPNIYKFEKQLQNLKEQSRGNKKLLPGVWEIDLSHGLYFLSNLITVSEDHGLQSKVLFFENEPSWVITPVEKKLV